MLIASAGHRDFFRRRLEVLPARSDEGELSRLSGSSGDAVALGRAAASGHPSIPPRSKTWRLPHHSVQRTTRPERPPRPSGPPSPRAAAALALAAVVGAIGLAVVLDVAGAFDRTTTVVRQAAPAATTRGTSLNAAALYAGAAPGVVDITAHASTTTPAVRSVCRARRRRPRRAPARWTTQGHIVTADHVVDGAISVSDPSGRHDASGEGPRRRRHRHRRAEGRSLGAQPPSARARQLRPG